MRVFITIVLSLIFWSCENDNSKPNILWIVTEDNSIHYMNLYTDGGAEMSQINALADQGVSLTMRFQIHQSVQLQEVLLSQVFTHPELEHNTTEE